MSDPAVIADRARYAEVGREYRQLEPAHDLVVEYRRAESDMEGAKDLVDEDEEFAELYETSKARILGLEEEIRMAMIDRDPNDDKDVIIELRPGTGGEEAGNFAADLYRMLTRYAERLKFKYELIEADDGGRFAARVDRVAKGQSHGDAWDELALLCAEMCGRRTLPLPRFAALWARA